MAGLSRIMTGTAWLSNVRGGLISTVDWGEARTPTANRWASFHSTQPPGFIYDVNKQTKKQPL